MEKERNRKRKEYRELTIGEMFCSGGKTAPQLRIQGLWLRELGFQAGDPVRVKCEEGKLVITLDKVKLELDEQEDKKIQKLYHKFLKEKGEVHTQFVAERRARYMAE